MNVRAAASAPTILVWHPGSPYATGDVSRGLVRGLRAAGVRVVEYQQAGRFSESKRYLRALVARRRKAGLEIKDPTYAEVARHASAGVLEVAARVRPDWILVVNGGYQDPTFYVYLRQFGFRVALVGTEAPYQIAAELHLARHVDHVFVNERRCLDVYRAVTDAVSYLPAAWDPAVHHPGAGRDLVVPEASRRAPWVGDGRVRSHDVVFVGSAFEERIAWLEAIEWTGIDLGLYGDFGLLSRRSPLRRFFRGRKVTAPIPNQVTAALYAAAKLGINLHRSSGNLEPNSPRIIGAESANPRTYELAACGVAVVTDYRPEVAELYGGRGVCRTPADMETRIRHLLAHDDQRATLAACLRAAVGDQSWIHRARTVLETLGDFGGAYADGNRRTALAVDPAL